MCFIDLKSAFDTIWRDGLTYKLTKLNISRKFINLINNMNSKVQNKIKTDDGFTKPFQVVIGTRQGCNLSPSLFNCYLSDLPKLLDDINAKQLTLIDQKISCLMYADDLVLFSKTSQGLQKLISATEKYCNNWQLAINTSKTKIMIVNKRKVDPISWKVYGEDIEIVKTFCYLGFELNTKNNFTNTIDRLHNKACKAYIGIREHFNFHNGTSVKVMIKLFDSMVKSIATYGSELWGILGWRKNNSDCVINYLLSKNHTFEKLHSRFCKQTLGLDNQTPDILAKAELGRYPIMSTIIKLCYGYWQHVLASNPKSLTYKALKSNIGMDRKGINSYYTRIKCILEILDTKSKIYPVEKTQIASESRAVSKVYDRMYKNYFFQILNEKRSNESQGKFAIYCISKRNYIMENYLNKIRHNHLRRNISGIRCASNLLPVNYLRKFNIKKESRLCSMCNNNEIGTELHVIMLCENVEIKPLRLEFLKLLYDFSPQLSLLQPEQQFNYIVQAIEEPLTLYFAIYLQKVYRLLKKKMDKS